MKSRNLLSEYGTKITQEREFVIEKMSSLVEG
jgi:hypothetical protein